MQYVSGRYTQGGRKTCPPNGGHDAQCLTASLQAPKPKQRTLDNTREADETIVTADDTEVGTEAQCLWCAHGAEVLIVAGFRS